MKRLLYISVLAALFLIGCSNDIVNDDLNWETNLETAVQKAKQENKTVLVNFTGSDWCIWCKRLTNEVFSKSEFASYAEKNLILVKLDFPRDIEQTEETKLYNNQLAQKYNIQGFPTIILLNNNGVKLAQTGYQPGGADNYIKLLESYL